MINDLSQRWNLLGMMIIVIVTMTSSIHGEIDTTNSRQTIDDSKSPKSTIPNENCDKFYGPTCFKLDVVTFIEKLSVAKNFGILPGVSVVENNDPTIDVPASEIVANLARDFPNDVDKRLDAYLVHKVGNYLNSHALSIKLFDPKTFEAARSFNDDALSQLGLFGNSIAETGRKKDKGGMNALMAGLMMMKGTLGTLGFGALALLAGKALMTGLMALMLSAIIGLKSLTSGGEKKTTYEIVSKPVYSTSHSHSTEEHHGGGHGGYGNSGYGRSLDALDETVQEAVRKYANVRDRRAI